MMDSATGKRRGWGWRVPSKSVAEPDIQDIAHRAMIHINGLFRKIRYKGSSLELTRYRGPGLHREGPRQLIKTFVDIGRGDHPRRILKE